MVIYPEIIVTPDLPTIRFKQPKEQIDLDVEIPKILHAQGWACGTYFNIQFVSHDKTKLLSTALYVVTEEVESLQTNESNPYQPVSRTLISRKAEIIGDWKNFVGTSAEVEVRWNPGLKKHQVLSGDKVIYESSDKDEALKVANS